MSCRSVFQYSYGKGPARWWLPLAANQCCFEMAEELLHEGACLPHECELVALEDASGNPTFVAFLRNWSPPKAMEIQLITSVVEHQR